MTFVTQQQRKCNQEIILAFFKKERETKRGQGDREAERQRDRETERQR